MNTFETQLAERMHDMADGEFDSAVPAAGVLARGRTAGRRRAAVRIAGASLAVLAVGGVVTAVAAHPSRTDHSTATVAESPQLKLMAAVAASESTSYQLEVTTRVRST